MPVTHPALLAVAVLLAAYGVAVLALVLCGRRDDARGLAAFVPDCLVLVRRLLRDPRVARRHKLGLGFVAGYLLVPFDLVPDFIPVAGQLDDAILLALALRAVVRAGGDELLRLHWPGPERSLRVVRALASVA